MPRHFVERAGGTWKTVDVFVEQAALDANTAADAVQDADRALRALAMSGDVVFVADPATATSSAAAVTADIADAEKDNKFTQVITFTLETAAGAVHTWWSGTRTIGITDDADGTAAIADTATATTLKFVNGVGTVTVEYEGVWVAGKVCTLTLTDGNVLGHEPGNATFVDTLGA